MSKNVGPIYGAISVDGVPRIAKSVEVTRMWVEDGGPANFFIAPDALVGPEMFGMLMTDCVRHAARAFAQCHDISEGEALERIWVGLDAERDNPTDEPVTHQDFDRKLN
jgi:hypothetical protein